MRLRRALLHRLSVREWGRPSGLYVGKAWRSEERQTVTCILPSGRGGCRTETRPVVVVPGASTEWVPATWRRAARRYSLGWPASAAGVASWALLTPAERKQPLLDVVASLRDAVGDVTTDPDLSEYIHSLSDTLLAWSGDYRLGHWS